MELEPYKQTKRGNLRDKVDRDLLHRYLWNKRTHQGFMTGTQDELAAKLGIGKVSMSLILKEMSERGMIIKRKRRWQIVDPTLYALGEKPEEDGRLFE